MNGGNADAYLDFIKEMAERVEVDLKNGIIPIAHDESYINNYLVKHRGEKNISYLPCDYAYPEEYDIPFDRKIILTDKRNYFEVNQIKFTSHENRTIMEKMLIRTKLYMEKTLIVYRCIVDKILRKNAN